MFPPSAEVTVITQNVPVTIGDDVKIDHAQGFEFVSTANYSITAEFRIYRDATLIHTRTLDRVGAAAGTNRIPFCDTHVDTAVANTTSLYEIRVIVTAATNITSATANNPDLNLIVF